MKKIVILGGGFGGLRTAIVVAKKLRWFNLEERYEVLLIDRNNYHTYTPLLYEVATTPTEIANRIALQEVATYDLRIATKPYPITFVRSGVETIDLVAGMINLEYGESIQADYLVLALGSETNFMDIEGLQTYALPLKTLNDAMKIRAAVMAALRGTEGEVRIVIGGAGSTGVGLAGELAELGAYHKKKSAISRLELTLIEGAPRILPTFEEKIAKKAAARLSQLGVQIITHKKIIRLDKEKLYLEKSEPLPVDLFIWTGGIKPEQTLSRLPVKREVRGRAEVIGDMKCIPETPDLELYSKVYGLGDIVCTYYPKTGKPAPSVARAAISQGNVVAHNIVETIKLEEGLSRKAKLKTFAPMAYPYIIPVGGRRAIAKIGPLVLNGFSGWVLKGLVELNYLTSIMPLSQAVKTWLKGLKIFMQNDKLK